MSKSTKTSSTTNEQQHVVSTPTNPEWVTSGVSGLQDKINNLLNVDPQSLVPGASQLQQQGFDQAGKLGDWRAGNTAAQGVATSLLDAPMTAAQAQAATATSRGLLDTNLEAYQNPFLKSVIDTTLAGNDEQTAMRRAELAAAQARGQKFSGSGSAIERALFERGALTDRAATEAQLRAAGFDRATGLATGDLNREADTSRFNASNMTQTSQFNAGQTNAMTTAERDAQLRAAGLLGDLSNSSAANDRADIGVLSDQGATQRDIAAHQAAAPISLLQLISSLNANQPYDLFKGVNSDSTGTSNTTGKSRTTGVDSGDIAKVAAAAIMASDKRLKSDIETVGKDEAGRRVVSFRYKGEPKHTRRVGYIAQEVEKTDPHAVFKGPGGYRMINLGLLGEAA